MPAGLEQKVSENYKIAVRLGRLVGCTCRTATIVYEKNMAALGQKAGNELLFTIMYCYREPDKTAFFTGWKLPWLNLINPSVRHFSALFSTILIIIRGLWLPELRERRFCLRCPFEASRIAATTWPRTGSQTEHKARVLSYPASSVVSH
jgi:hypothetical protein